MEKIYVAVRARRLSPEESQTSPWRISENSIFLANRSAVFEFDRVFGEDCKTFEIFDTRAKDIVASVVRGFNGTVFAYGQTSSGKTYTMTGSASQPGIIPLSVHELFRIIQEKVDREFLVRVSYMEIYNEEINDLLALGHRKLQIHESLERGIYVAGLKEEIVTSPEQVLQLMEFGEFHRHIGETNMNLYSSRSHTIFRMIVESRERSGEGDSINCFDAVRVSVLNLVDLAGSERAVKTGAEGVRLREGSYINKCLMTLGTVIKKLSDGVESQGGHVPYRDSKLTRILQPALGGNANTAMICNITLSQIHVDETKSSLLFASRALRVKNYACVNEIVTDAALLKRQKREIEELRAKLLSSHSEHLEEEILVLRNNLLQSELEKERIALELEEEKKAKACREIRLLEQERKIENLSSLILSSERDEKSSYSFKERRRVTWCPGPFQKKMINEENCAFNGDTLPLGSCLPEIADGADKAEAFFLPDEHALLNVTYRKKTHQNRDSLNSEEEQSLANLPEFGDLSLNSDSKDVNIKLLQNNYMESESIPMNKITASSTCHLKEFVSPDHCNLTVRETGAILVIKRLEEQIESLEMEKNSLQMNLDNVVTLATEQNACFREKCEDLQREVRNAQEVARAVYDELELVGDSTQKLFDEVGEIALHFCFLKESFENLLAIPKDFMQLFSFFSEIILSFMTVPMECVAQFKSLILGQNCVNRFMIKKIEKFKFEKNLLGNQLCQHQKQILELECCFENREKITAEQGLQDDMEKEELLSQIYSLQKEVSRLSSSSLAREKESLRKELDKTKSKFKDIESKLKNTIQDKVKLESEKAQIEREVKSLQGQRALLERSMLKHESNAVSQKNLQDEYQKLVFSAFEMEADIASMKEALEITIGEKEEAVVKNEILETELDLMSSKLNTALVDAELLKEELVRMEQSLSDSKTTSRSLEDSLSYLSRQKEDIVSQLKEALLEVEIVKSTADSKEKTLTEKLKISNDEIVRLTENLSKEASASNKEINDLQAKLSSTQAKLDCYRGRLKETVDEMKLMDTKYKEASTMLKNQLRTYGQHILDLTKKLAEKD
ncbi:hypothetical protein HPP92_010502 [Vanilla planifolia]|uniref:Kinesin motor domain-containing protein n=1 Tax=Vanilla planifolia TaxID=51239 RepID=A0A835R9R3_VANPL|nr:hypothetical protein HPP92_010502 [Vanilla planifolia]